MSCDLNKSKVDLESSTSGDFAKYYEYTKAKFYNDFVTNISIRNEKRISAGKTDAEIEKCFEHLTSQGTMDSKSRIPDLRRLESIYILKDILTNSKCAKCEKYYVWEKKEKYLKEKIFCPETGYLIILAKRQFVYKLVSAYVIEGKKKKLKLINECKKNK